jgi:hypothetical protein
VVFFDWDVKIGPVVWWVLVNYTILLGGYHKQELSFGGYQGGS